MKRQIAVVSLWVFIFGLTACSLRQNYLYRPSPFERAVARATTTAEDGKVTITKVAISDMDVYEWAEAIEQAWRKRDQVARGIEIGGGSAESGLGIISSIMGFLELWPGVGQIIGTIGSYITKLTSLINASGRTEAYADGTRILSAAKVDYIKANGGQAIATDKLTEPGARLLSDANCVVARVESAISGRVIDQSGVCGEVTKK